MLAVGNLLIPYEPDGSSVIFRAKGSDIKPAEILMVSGVFAVLGLASFAVGTTLSWLARRSSTA